MGVKHAARKTIRALSVPDFALYDRHDDCWRLCASEHTKIRQFGHRWGVEFVEGPCPKSHIGVDLVKPLDAPMIGCFEEEKIHAFFQDLWYSRILPDVNRSFMSSYFATTTRDNPSVIVISESDMAFTQSAPDHPALASSEVEVESTRVLTMASEMGTSPIREEGERALVAVKGAESEEAASTSSSSALQPRRTRKTRASANLESEFALTKNLLYEADLGMLRLKYGISSSEYRLFLEKEVVEMSTKAIPIPVAHFEAGLWLPLDPGFVEFLIFVRAQPAHLHPNVVRLIMAMIVLCRRHGVEVSANLVRHFFSSLRMVNNVLSMRPRAGVVSLFDGLPNKIRWTNKWAMIEAKHGFPFLPLIGQIRKWEALGSNTQWSDDDLKFLDIIKENLGDDPHDQEKYYKLDDLLSGASLAEAGIGVPDENRRELGLVSKVSEYNVWTLHPGRVFSNECQTCMSQPSAGCMAVDDESILPSCHSVILYTSIIDD